MSDRVRANIIYWSVVSVLSIAAFCLLFFLRGDYSMVGWINACFFSGGIILGLGLLALVAHFGAFDMFVYGFGDIFYHMNPSKNKVRKYSDYVDYVEKKKETRQRNGYTFLWPFLTYGLCLLLAAIILRIILAADTGLGI